MARSRNARGEFAGRIPAGEALEVFEQRDDMARPLTANDITEACGWSRRTAHNKLSELVERDVLATRKVGARGRVWWVPADEGSNSSPDMTVPDPVSVEEIPTTPTEVLERCRDEIPARNEEARQERAHAVLTAYEYLQREGDAPLDEIQEHIAGAHPDGDPERQWVNYVRPGLVALPGIQKPPQGASRWHFVDPNGELAEKLNVPIEDSVARAEVTGSGKIAERYRAIIQIAYDYLKHRGSAEKGDFKRNTPNYSGHYINFDGMWSYFLREALGELPGVERPRHGARGWSYIEPGGKLDRKLSIECENWVANIEVPSEGVAASRLRTLIQIAYNHLKEAGNATKEDFEQALPSYTGHYTGFSGLWTYLLKDALKQGPDVETSREDKRGPTTYTYTGD